ncbi:hypothetical protein SHKM778_92260 [Streptomyces sp. KM77-8]|uniref:SIP-like Rossmann fold domain-containing protein n=1 Tax=Streptomyces haneummycinicus TaxID=3074435 RepID=A0AAT9HZN2_9ACTN
MTESYVKGEKTMAQGRGWEGAVLKLFRAKDFTFTVTGTEDVTAGYRRLRLTDGGMLAATGVHPTMWVRLWFDNAGKPHQRAYTLVDPDPVAGTFGLEFALHEGAPATGPGRRIPATPSRRPCRARGSRSPPRPPPRLRDRRPRLAAGRQLPARSAGVRPGDRVVRGHPRRTALAGRPGPARGARGAPVGHGAGRAGTGRPPALLASTPDPYVWIACDTATTRALSAYVRKELGVPKQRVHALGYWRAS